MMKLSLLFCALAMFALGAVNCTSPQQAPAPSGDCSTLIFNLVDCLSFVTNGSKVSKPQGGCCNGLKTVLKADVQCVCQAFKNSAQLGVVLNVTKTLTLPAACGVSDSDISSCGLSGGAPNAAPAPPPKSSSPTPSSPKSPVPSPPVAHAPSPATYPGGGNTDEAPAPAPNSASSFSISLTALLVSVLVALCSYF